MKEDITSFELPGNLACNQATNRVCVVGVRNYLAALTADGFVIFNTRNPGAVRLETVPNNIGAGYSYLIRSGERLWAVKNSAMDTTEIAWLDLPLDGRSPVSPPSKATVRVPYLSSRLAAPNDAIYLYHYSSGGNTARYAPGLPTNLPSYFANDAQETGAAASSGPRLLLFSVVVDYNPSPIITYQFSLQSDPASPQSANSGTYELPAMINSFISSGYFASSRSGAVAWVLARRDEANDWKDLRAYWLVANQTAPLDHVSTILETYTTQPTVTQGQVAFINDDTIAITVMSGTSAPSPMLDIVQRKTGNPSLLKRIPLSPIAPGNFNVAGDAGYAYVVTGTTVRMFAPSCKP
jgi:hypothetical protein